MVNVEVPEYGQVLVDGGIVRKLHEQGTTWRACWCGDDEHRIGYRSRAPMPGKSKEPHLIAIRTFELTWRLES